MERFLIQNTYQAKQARYRGFKSLQPLGATGDHEAPRASHTTTSSVAAAAAAAAGPVQFEVISLEKLWTYASPLSKERNVSCMCWNKKNRDILAVGYGKFEYNEEQSGLVCCWSLKNPEFPERFYKTEAGVTALDFANKHANLLAVGLFNGTILVFDVRSNNTEPLLSTKFVVVVVDSCVFKSIPQHCF